MTMQKTQACLQNNRRVFAALLASAGFVLCSPFAVLAENAPAAELNIQQQKTITGTVIDGKTGEPVIGASVKQKGSTRGSITNVDGKFQLPAAPGVTLEISYIGFITKEVTATGQPMTIKLDEDFQKLDEVVVVGYGTTSKRKTTAAITTVNADDLAKVPVPNITQTLAGRAPGLIVQSSGGGLGNTASISIRGGGTPLYVIDGIISETRDFENLNPEDIDQMTVLKDASATAVYGARAANGIILITTKKGKSGKMKIDYGFTYTWSNPVYLPKKLDSYWAAYYVNKAQENDGLKGPYTEEELQKYKDGSDPYNYPNTDWQAITMRNAAPEQKHTLSVSGGNDRVSFYTGLGYYNQEAIYKTNSNNMQRYNLRTNIVANFDEIGLKMTSGIDAYIWDLAQPNTLQGSGNYTIWSHIQNKTPMQLGYNKFGQIYSGTNDSPLIDISDDGGYFKQERSSVTANMQLEWSVPEVDGLKLRGLGSYTIVNDRNKSWAKTPYAYDLEGNQNTPGKPSLSKNVYYHRNFTLQAFADYNKSFGQHTVGATLGMEASGSDYDNSSLSRQEFLLDVDQMGAGPVEGMSNGSSEGTSYRRAAFIGRLKYDYAAKYMVELNMRRDGSDYFPKGNRWGNFYSASAGWVISEENFWKVLRDNHIFDMFKIRGSYGEIGLDGSTDGSLSRYAYLPSYSLNQRGNYLGGQFVPGFTEGALVSTDITWYKNKNFNIGFDFGSLNNRLSGSVDYFRMTTTGYLASPSNVGYTAPLGKSLPKVKSNGESVRQGFEFVLQWKDQIRDFRYGISANFTIYDSRWNINPNESEVNLKNPYQRTTQVGAYTGIAYENLGFYTGFDDIMNSPKRQSSTNLVAGDLKYYDFNGDGIIDGNDQIRMGHGSSPRGNYGINVDLGYKGWFFNMLWQGATPYDIAMGNIIQGTGMYLPVVYEFQTDYWTPDNTNARYPRLHSSTGYNGNNNYVSTDFWYVNAAYIRLKTISLGYDFKEVLLKKVSWLSRCTISLTGYNLLTFSPSKKYGMDPEIGEGNLYNYPTSKSYSISINLGF